MSRALVLSGGAFRGAVQVPIIEHLKKKHEYDAVYGVSVGAINGIMFAQNDMDELREIWETVDGLSGFLANRFYWPFKGAYSLKPIRKKMEKYTSLSRIEVPFYAGVVSFTDGEYYNLGSDSMKTDKELWETIQASSCMAGIMIPEEIMINGEPHLGCDGGFRNIIPVPNDVMYDHIDVVTCTPIDRMKMKNTKFDKRNVLSVLIRAIEIFEDEIFDKDIIEILERTNSEISIYSPAEYPGDSFDASRETIEMRYKLGEEAILNPLILANK